MLKIRLKLGAGIDWEALGRIPQSPFPFCIDANCTTLAFKHYLSHKILKGVLEPGSLQLRLQGSDRELEDVADAEKPTSSTRPPRLRLLADQNVRSGSVVQLDVCATEEEVQRFLDEAAARAEANELEDLQRADAPQIAAGAARGKAAAGRPRQAAARRLAAATTALNATNVRGGELARGVWDDGAITAPADEDADADADTDDEAQARLMRELWRYLSSSEAGSDSDSEDDSKGDRPVAAAGAWGIARGRSGAGRDGSGAGRRPAGLGGGGGDGRRGRSDAGAGRGRGQGAAPQQRWQAQQPPPGAGGRAVRKRPRQDAARLSESEEEGEGGDEPLAPQHRRQRGAAAAGGVHGAAAADDPVRRRQRLGPGQPAGAGPHAAAANRPREEEASEDNGADPPRQQQRTHGAAAGAGAGAPRAGVLTRSAAAGGGGGASVGPDRRQRSQQVSEYNWDLAEVEALVADVSANGTRDWVGCAERLKSAGFMRTARASSRKWCLLKQRSERGWQVPGGRTLPPDLRARIDALPRTFHRPLRLGPPPAGYSFDRDAESDRTEAPAKDKDTGAFSGEGGFTGRHRASPGFWSLEETIRLVDWVQLHGAGDWSAFAEKNQDLRRNPEQVKMRWRSLRAASEKGWREMRRIVLPPDLRARIDSLV
ncbi:hypothetical protein HXX76_007879 [Chlamydomonas incerta]|uniref:Myb-like domain-containing protein n=1 Tax=Chlamydomonas incerta TaxID=51695 RepID=A0A835SVL2_CHLIN|nr:hypothetical protein HXX76_007879 [Chlamydomonas incerta]|eukprot:KAG2434152.1 hypothetical protein HXX76_007879 [Chlamydomonas incerta]